MSLPTVYQQGPACCGTPLYVPVYGGGGGGVTIAVTPNFTYRVVNLGGNTVDVYEDSASGPLLDSIDGLGAAKSFTLGDNTSALFLRASTSGQTTQVIVQPVLSEVVAGIIRSPLSYVLKCPTGSAKFIGSFYSRDGRELRDSGDNSSFEISVSTTAKTLGEAFLARTSPPSPNLLFADAFPFIGVMYGDPVSVMPGSLQANTTGSTPSSPISNGLTIFPGPVVLGGVNRVAQTSSGPGFTNYPFASSALSSSSTSGTISSGQKSTVVNLDVRSAVIGILAVRCTRATGLSIRVQAYRRFVALDSTEWVSDVAGYDETFSADGTSGTFTGYVELDQGLWQFTVEAIGATATGAAYMLQTVR